MSDQILTAKEAKMNALATFNEIDKSYDENSTGTRSFGIRSLINWPLGGEIHKGDLELFIYNAKGDTTKSGIISEAFESDHNKDDLERLTGREIKGFLDQKFAKE